MLHEHHRPLRNIGERVGHRTCAPIATVPVRTPPCQNPETAGRADNRQLYQLKQLHDKGSLARAASRAHDLPPDPFHTVNTVRNSRPATNNTIRRDSDESQPQFVSTAPPRAQGSRSERGFTLMWTELDDTPSTSAHSPTCSDIAIRPEISELVSRRSTRFPLPRPSWKHPRVRSHGAERTSAQYAGRRRRH